MEGTVTFPDELRSPLTRLSAVEGTIGVDKEEQERQVRWKVEEKMIKPKGSQTQPSSSTDEAHTHTHTTE